METADIGKLAGGRKGDLLPFVAAQSAGVEGPIAGGRGVRRPRRRLQSQLQAELKLTFGEMLTFDGARCDRLVAQVLERLAAIPPA